MLAAETMTWPRSGSDAVDAYDRLDPQIRRWIREQGWAGLRDIQSEAIGAIMESDGDVVISASTVSLCS